MRVKAYKISKNKMLDYLCSLPSEQQMFINHKFGKQAKRLNLTIDDYLWYLITSKRLTYMGAPVLENVSK